MASRESAPVTSSQSSQVEAFEKWQKLLSDEREVLERQAERQYAGLESLLNRALWVFGILGTVAVGILSWFFGKSRQDLKQAIRDTFERQAREIVEKEAGLLRQRYENLSMEVEELSAYKRRQVVWVSKPEIELEPVSKSLFSIGIQNISFVTPDVNEPFDIGQPDLAILSFDGTHEARRMLGVLVERLKEESPPVPLLIYTFAPEHAQVKLEPEDLAILNDYLWYVPVNFPAQLLAQTQLLIRRSRSHFGGEHGQL